MAKSAFVELGRQALAVGFAVGRARVHLRVRGDADGEAADLARQVDELLGVHQLARLGALVGRRIAAEREQVLARRPP